MRSSVNILLICFEMQKMLTKKVPEGLLKKPGFPMTAQKSVKAVCVIEPFRAF